MLLHCLLLVPSQHLVGPGSVTPYGGGGGGRRHGGYVTIRDAVNGFFVAGSAIDDLNGVYGPRLQDVSGLPEAIARDVAIGAYLHESSGWILANVRTDAAGRQTEWVFFDAARRERFAHAGNTLIPGSGHRWRHLHRLSRAPPDAATDDATATGGGGGASGSTAVSAAIGDDDDEVRKGATERCQHAIEPCLRPCMHPLPGQAPGHVRGSLTPPRARLSDGRAWLRVSSFRGKSSAVRSRGDSHALAGSRARRRLLRMLAPRRRRRDGG